MRETTDFFFRAADLDGDKLKQTLQIDTVRDIRAADKAFSARQAAEEDLR
jgi:hypothetical protein